MAYNSNIPQANDQLSQSQIDLLNNFQAINTWTQINHVGFNVGDSGKHTWVTMQQQTGATPFVGTEIGLYNFNWAAKTGINELWFRASTGFNYPISASTLSTIALPGVTAGFTYFPSGVLVKWGQITLGGPTSGTVIFALDQSAAGGPRFNTIMNVMLTGVAGGGSPTASFYYVSSNLVPTPQEVTIRITNSTASAFMYYIIGA